MFAIGKLATLHRYLICQLPLVGGGRCASPDQSGSMFASNADLGMGYTLALETSATPLSSTTNRVLRTFVTFTKHTLAFVPHCIARSFCTAPACADSMQGCNGM